MATVQYSGLFKIGIFYDGQYFLKVSNYYSYSHERRSRLSISGIHDFVRSKVSETINIDQRLCQIVDAHYFRGRLSARHSQESDSLFHERQFDEVLMRENVTTHYLPIKNLAGRRQEKGIDVWLALEAYELAVYKRFDLLVLVACDGDYVPLVRKLSTLGTRVMLLSWDFSYQDENNNTQTTRTSQDLLEEVTYPVAMHQVIEDRVSRNSPLINNLFVPRAVTNSKFAIFEGKVVGDARVGSAGSSEIRTSEILSIKEGFGFIKSPPNNIFFHYTALADTDFNELYVGDKVTFTTEEVDGKIQARNVRKATNI